ncbi:MAG: redox-regulated ATPase YchF [Planctomycetes bacterium]|nr:redox-regulated ATPase YchF [Planctomycetota bacterium]
MGLACGIVGLPNVGKSTIYNAITLTEGGDRSNYMFSTTEPIRGTVDVPDPRLEQIAKFIETSRIVPAQMTVVDIPGLVSGASHGEGMGIGFLGAIKESNCLLHVVRCFESSDVQHVSGAIDPAADAEIVELELAQADLQTLDRNIDRVAKKARTGDKEYVEQKVLFERAKAHLETSQPLRMLEFSPRELELLAPLFLMTIKPVLFVANVGDSDVDGTSDHVKALREYAEKTRADVMHLCGDLEAEFIRMDEEERATFMEDFGLKESGLTRMIHAGFDLLGLQTFFTAGELEVRAWVIHQGDTAPIGAGAIHTDFTKKFIRAQVYKFDDLVQHETEAAIKAAGKLRSEGKEYVLQDGDICHFLIGN